jgi:hypothetical protein
MTARDADSGVRRYVRGLAALLLLVATAVSAGGNDRAAAGTAAPVPDHPSLLPPLALDNAFPRFTSAQLAAAGFPDHLHACRAPSWVPLVDEAGETYGPFSLARGTEILPRPGLAIEPGAIRYRGIQVFHETAAPATLLLPFVELLDWARRDLPPLLGHDRDDTLRVRDPGTLDAYTAETGQRFWRLDAWRDGVCVIEPVATLASRTLDGHAAFAIVTEWLLVDAAGEGAGFPAWFRSGVGSYLGEYGVHLVNYVAEFRAAGLPVVFTPARTDSLLTGLPLADPELDRRLYRTASYSAFLMVWELIENRGGLAALQRVVQAMAAGAAPDDACRRAYRSSWAELAAAIAATDQPEPLGEAVQPRSPHILPTPAPDSPSERPKQP